MSEIDLFNLARATTAVEIGYFTQMITINFAMIVAIYYFLNQANLPMKILAFIAYYNRTMAKPIKWTYTGLG